MCNIIGGDKDKFWDSVEPLRCNSSTKIASQTVYNLEWKLNQNHKQDPDLDLNQYVLDAPR